MVVVKTLTIACFDPRLVLAYLCDPNPHGNLCCTAKPPMSEMWKYAASKNISSGPNSAPSQPGQVLSWSWTIGSCDHCWAPLAPWALALGTCVGHFCWATFGAICKYTYANCRLIVVIWRSANYIKFILTRTI